MSGGPRNLEAAGIAARGFLISIGALALLAWFPARYLADWAVYPIELYLDMPRDLGGMTPSEDFAMSKSDFRWILASSAATFGWLAAFYWLIVFLLGAARVDRPPSGWLKSPACWLAVAFLIGMGGAFLVGARRLVVGPLIDNCTANFGPVYLHGATCLDCAIHTCEFRVMAAFGYASLLGALLLMGVSLWLRRRAARAALASAA